ncbi:S9 family peptidase [Paraglaciecola sp. 20A4]|uniref:S9 family peptidase n=1 Tax=Paraglaciecola sp. 20A4 TaxID=2687288 RepID=UPI0014096330|nr:S9 family peptidase [Paraglaciecola sp. 20A4]
MNKIKKAIVLTLLTTPIALSMPYAFADSADKTLKLEDIFTLEYASGLDITNDGKAVYFVRNYMDIQSDKKLGNIWKVTKDRVMTPVTNGLHADFSPTLSPDETKLAFISTASGAPQVHIKWLISGQTGQITHLSGSPSNLSWSPDGKRLAFSQFVKGTPKSPVSLKGKPEGAKWADSAIYIDDLFYRADGAGYIPAGNSQIFVVSADGGTPRQLTQGEFDHGGNISWSSDSKAVVFSANRRPDSDLELTDNNVYRVDIASGEMLQLTDRIGPDNSPVVSPDGKLIAYLGYDEKYTNYENTQLYVIDANGGVSRSLTNDFDRSIGNVKWAHDSKGLYVSYDDKGETYVAYQPLKGKRKVVAEKVGGLSFGRPYSGGAFDVAKDGTVAFTYSDPQRPADIAIQKGEQPNVLTQLNEDALGYKDLANIKELNLTSSFDDMPIQAWVAYPPGFEEGKKQGKRYPLILEIHGGPVANYGPHFSAEIQLMAAQGYVVVYANPRGSDSYGKAFAQTIDKNYPSQDYDDLMSTVDTVIAQGSIDDKNLFVTGGSGGGTLTAWIVGHTERFAAAVVAKPVINWYSFVLTSDFYPFFYKNWFGKKPWEAQDLYMKHSPISYVGNVTTPTMLLTGESDHRTPISETEQYYQALKLQGVESAMVRIPGASHSIYKRPSNLMSKVGYIMWWFDKHRTNKSIEHDSSVAK